MEAKTILATLSLLGACARPDATEVPAAENDEVVPTETAPAQDPDPEIATAQPESESESDRPAPAVEVHNGDEDEVEADAEAPVAEAAAPEAASRPVAERRKPGQAPAQSEASGSRRAKVRRGYLRVADPG